MCLSLEDSAVVSEATRGGGGHEGTTSGPGWSLSRSYCGRSYSRHRIRRARPRTPALLSLGTLALSRWQRQPGCLLVTRRGRPRTDIDRGVNIIKLKVVCSGAVLDEVDQVLGVARGRCPCWQPPGCQHTDCCYRPRVVLNLEGYQVFAQAALQPLLTVHLTTSFVLILIGFVFQAGRSAPDLSLP